ncbi:MAG: glycosyltransferase [Anaerolineae bacterium]|nr:glycosyltransferase [Anaerolineae bacterium]
MATKRSVRRIAMLSVHTSPLATLGGKKTGGMNVYIRDLSRELGRQGIAVDVFTRADHPDQPRSAAFGDNVRVIHVQAGPPSVLGSYETYLHLPAFVTAVLQFVTDAELTYDVVYSHYWLSGWVAHELRAQWGVPVVQMFHTLGRMKNRIAQEPGQGEADIRIFTETDIMSWADRLIAATPAERAQLLWLYRADRRKIEIVPPGVDLARFQPMSSAEARGKIGIPQEDRLLLFVGRIEPLKGVDNILRAMALLREDDPALLANVRAVVIGGDVQTPAPDGEMSRLMTLTDELDVGDRVCFLGARDQDVLPYYYCAAEALIMPSDYESFGMVALEAMACGTPVIASEVGGLAFLVQDGVNGFHVPTREPAALAERIRMILDDPARHAEIRQAARDTAQVYDWPLIADRLLSVFDDVMQKHVQQQKQTGIHTPEIPAQRSS